MKNIITIGNIRDFEMHLRDEERSENTVEKYLRDVRAFAVYSNGKKLTKSDVLDYKRLLCESYAPRSVNSMISSLNAFFSFMGRHDLKVRTIKIQRQIFADQCREFTKTEYARMLSAAKKSGNSRMYYLMQLIGSTGIRVSEIRYITCDAVNRGQATINCKGKIRKIFLTHQLCKMLKAYIRKRHIKNGPVFVSRSGQPLNRSNIWKMLKALCSLANVAKEKVFPHNFRHLFARTYYSVQKDIVRLADILGHSSINTTRIYTMESSTVYSRHIRDLGLLRC